MSSRTRVLTFGLLAMSLPVVGQDYQPGNVAISDPWSRPTPPGTPVGVGYMAISNQGQEPVTLVTGQTPAAAQVSLHKSTMQDGLMKMRRLKDGLTVSAGETVTLEPHSYHLMLEQLERPLKAGDEIPLSLTFEGMDPVDVKLRVRSQ